MAAASQRTTPSLTAEGSTPTCDECRRKVINNTEVEKNCEFKENPLVTKATLDIEAMR